MGNEVKGREGKREGKQGILPNGTRMDAQRAPLNKTDENQTPTLTCHWQPGFVYIYSHFTDFNEAGI